MQMRSTFITHDSLQFNRELLPNQGHCREPHHLYLAQGLLNQSVTGMVQVDLWPATAAHTDINVVYPELIHWLSYCSRMII